MVRPRRQGRQQQAEPLPLVAGTTCLPAVQQDAQTKKDKHGSAISAIQRRSPTRTR